MTKNRKRILIATAGALTMLMALAAVLVAPQATMAAPTNAMVFSRGMPPGGTALQADSDLADALGITVDELSEAIETARIAAIDQALEKDLITQAQADALKKNQRAGLGERFGGRGVSGMLGMFGLDADIDQEALLADALGISVEKLQEAQQAAQDARIAQAVKNGKLTQEQADLMKAKRALQQYMEEQGFFAKVVQQAVEAGIVTQAQADSILDRQTSGMWSFGRGMMRDGLGDFFEFRGRSGRH